MQRSTHTAWPHTRSIGAVIISGKSEATWVAARATIPAPRAMLRQTWLTQQICVTRITKHADWPALPCGC